MRKGVVYQSGQKKSGEVEIAPIVAELKKIALMLKWASGGLMVFGIVGLVIIYWPLAMVEVGYQIKQVVKVPDPTPTIVQEFPTWAVPDQFYSIYIPKIDAISRVVPMVDINNEKNYQEALKLGVAEVAGLARPGKRGTTYLFSHSVSSPINFARYNAVFYLLDKLVVGDRIEIWNEGKLYKYEVTDREITKASDTKYLVPQQSEEKLVLQTCYPPGTTWQRLYVSAKRVY